LPVPKDFPELQRAGTEESQKGFVKIWSFSHPANVRRYPMVIKAYNEPERPLRRTG
jgi:hypothetical protein